MTALHKISLLLIPALLTCNYSWSQTASDIKMGEILNSGDLFKLREEYPALKDSVSIGMLNLVAETQLGVGFNRLENAAIAMDSLLQFHQEELGAETSIGIAGQRAMNLLNMGLYGPAGQAGEDLVNALKDAIPFESLYSFIFIGRMGKALADYPAPYVERPSHDVSIPMNATL